MNFNEFNRRLERCHLDEDTKYLFSYMFEVQMELSKQMDMVAGRTRDEALAAYQQEQL